MSEIVAIGDEELLAGYAAIGVPVVVASTPEEAIAAWDGPASTAGLVLLTPAAHAALVDRLDERRSLWAVLP
jgi:vacuolar-type H+-ATPase subunit F/Vma7